jgi:N-acetylmuramoyl-L-alanine amidase
VVLMSRKGLASVYGMLLVLAGCATGPRPDSDHAPNWSSEGTSAPQPPPLPPPPVPPAPALAPEEPQPTATLGATNDALPGWVPLDHWCLGKELPAPVRLALAPLPTYSLTSPRGVLILHAGSKLAQWDGSELRLGFAPQLIDGQPCVHGLDLKKSLEPLLLGGRLETTATNRVIVIDPGHGGEDSGARSVSGSRYEKEFTLDWARRLERLLTDVGWQVYLTRTNDTALSLSNRVAFADEHQAALFLSLHFNSAGAESPQSGLETYCLAPAGVPASITRGFGDDPSLVFPNNRFDAANLQIACAVHHALLQANGGNDRGVRRARFLGVLRAQNRPAVLIEGGFLSSRREASLILDPAYRQKLALAVARALQSCLATGTNSLPAETRAGL